MSRHTHHHNVTHPKHDSTVYSLSLTPMMKLCCEKVRVKRRNGLAFGVELNLVRQHYSSSLEWIC